MHKAIYNIILSSAILLSLCPCSSGASSVVREVKVSVTPFIPVSSWPKGYLEYRVKLTNKSVSNRRRVTLCMPEELKSGPMVESSFEVGTLSTVNGKFYLTSLKPFNGKDIKITVDGKSAGMEMLLPKYKPADAQISKKALILTSKSAPPFFSHRLIDQLKRYPNRKAETLRSAYAINEWSDSWLAYSACNAVVITKSDLPAMPQPVANALRDYVSMGGKILILGTNSLPENIFGPFDTAVPKRRMTLGLGEAMVLSDSKSKLPVRFLTATRPTSANIFSEALMPFAPQKLSKTMAMLIILSGYVIVIVLAVFISWKLRRRAVLAIALPAISILASAAIITCVAMSENFTDRHRLDSITFLDQSRNHANSFGLLGIYHPLNVKALSFNRQTAVEYLSDNQLLPGCHVSWNHKQNVWGFVEARKPGYFRLMRSSESFKGLKFEYTDKNPIRVFNNLSCDIETLLVRSKTGYHFIAKNVPPGQWTQLLPANIMPGNISTSQNTLFKTLGRFWPGLWQCKGYSDYIALVRVNPFLSAGLEHSDNIDSLSLICGKIGSVEK